MKAHVQMVNNYQSLTVATETYVPWVTGHLDPLLNLTVITKYLIRNMHVANSLKVSFTKFARAIFRNPVFDV